MNLISARTVIANGREYRFPQAPTIVVCIDGSEPDYTDAAIAAGVAPNLRRWRQCGAALTALSVIPSYTNPNNISIITGRPPSLHGISGNYFFDRASGEEVMMNDARFMRPGVTTIVKAFADAGASVAVVTAKDKLRALLSFGLDFAQGHAVAFSSEKADRATLAANGIARVLDLVGLPLPAVYSAGLSEFVFAAGVKLLEDPAPRSDVSVDHRLRAAQGRSGVGGRQCLLRHDRSLCRHLRSGGLRPGVDRRSRHERQAPARWRAGCSLSPGRA